MFAFEAVQTGTIALPGNFKVGWQPETMLAAWALMGWDKILEQPVADGLAQCWEARRGRRARKTDPHFPPPHQVRPGKATMLQVCEGQARHQPVTMQPGPRAALEVVEAEFFLELLMRLLAHSACLDRPNERPPRDPCREAGQVVLALARGALLAYQSDLIGDLHPEADGQLALGALAPHDTPPERSRVPPRQCAGPGLGRACARGREAARG